MPFGEWIPVGRVLARAHRPLRPDPARLRARFDTTGVLQVGPARLGDLICFEVAYDELGRAAVPRRRHQAATSPARARGSLAVQTNNATYGLTGQPEQQLAMSRLRAVEHGRAVLIAVHQRHQRRSCCRTASLAQTLGEFVRATSSQTSPLRDDLTLADRVGACARAASPLPPALVLLGSWPCSATDVAGT